MDATSLFKAVFALALVLGLILALAYGLRRYAPNLLARVSSPRGRKRLEVLETLVLDPTRRVVIVRVDDAERLILLGEGRELIEPRPHAERKAGAPQTVAPPATQNAAVEPPRLRPVAVATAPAAQAPAPPSSTSTSRAKLAAARAAYPRATTQDPNDDLF
jgi:flagellar protein FliO/FliZ